MFDQSNVKYIKRLVVGSDNPARLCTREETEAQMEELNDCLSGASHPRGTLLAVERSFTLVRIGDHQVVLEWMAYHVGFARKPPRFLAPGDEVTVHVQGIGELINPVVAEP